MRYLLALTAFLAVAASSPATAQMYPGEDVIVNPAAAGIQVLRYPGGKYVRIVPALRQPGETYGPIRLHMPTRHRLALVHNPRVAAAAPDRPSAAGWRRTRTTPHPAEARHPGGEGPAARHGVVTVVCRGWLGAPGSSGSRNARRRGD